MEEEDIEMYGKKGIQKADGSLTDTGLTDLLTRNLRRV